MPQKLLIHLSRMEFPSSHQLNQFISDLRVYEWFTQILIEHYKANSGDPDQTPRFAASVTWRLIWVGTIFLCPTKRTLSLYRLICLKLD